MDILRSNLAEVRGQAERSEQLEAELRDLSAKLQQAEAAVSAAGDTAGRLADSAAAESEPAFSTDGEDVAALQRRLQEAEAKLTAAAEEAGEAQQWQADETAELQAKLKKVEARLAAATSESEVELLQSDANAVHFRSAAEASVTQRQMATVTRGLFNRRLRRRPRMLQRQSCRSGWQLRKGGSRRSLTRQRRSTAGRLLCCSSA